MGHLPASLLLGLLICATTSFARTEPITQLPRDVRPLHYDLYLEPDAANASFRGQVAIRVEVLRGTRRIVLNAAELRIRRAELSGTVENETGFGTPAVTLDAQKQTAQLDFPERITPGRYLLVLEFDGRIGTQANGLFAVDYAGDGGPRRALYTQLAAPAARTMFPCWDEPAHKATFALEVMAPAGLMAVSNMPVVDVQDEPGNRQRTRFAPTPRMSTYLLFLALGDFERTSVSAGAVNVGVVTRRGVVAQAEFVRDSSRDVLLAYNEMFGMPYPLPKLDNVVAPGSSQFFAAMENWGAIMTFESSLLLDPAIATEADRQSAFILAAHEIAHQWFGNLVTMAWWDDLWLNEGFATWMGYRAAERLHPQWRTVLNQVAARDRAMALDALATTHPVVQPIATVDEVNQAFDVITYQKGSAVIRMLEAHVGEAAWLKGVRRYLSANLYGNATSEDLWLAIEAASSQPVRAIARDFTRQSGVPLVTVSELRCREGAGEVTLEQGEFTLDRPAKRPLRWRVPVAIASADTDVSKRLVLDSRRTTVALAGCGPVIVNAGQAGYYRVRYAPAAFAALQARFGALAPIDQLGLIVDSWALGQSGDQPASAVLALAQATPVDAEPQVWRRIVATLRQLDGWFPATGPDAARDGFRQWSVTLLQPLLARIGWEASTGESTGTAILRSDLLAALGAFGDDRVIDEARQQYRRELGGGAPIAAPLRRTLLGIVARHADASTWAELEAAALAESSPLMRAERFELLARPADPALARQALDVALSGKPDATLAADMIAAVAELHPDLAFDFAAENRTAVLQRVDSFSRSGYITGLAARSVDPGMPARIRTWAEAHIAPESQGDAEQSAATVALRARLRVERLPAVIGWIGAQSRS